MLGWAIRVVLLFGLGTAVIMASGILDAGKPMKIQAAKPVPSVAKEADGSISRELVVTLHSSGHFLVEAQINGATIPFLVDTGASKVTLSMTDAEKAGLDTNWLNFDERFHTANGIIRAAPTQIDDFRLGDIQLRDVEATVNEGDMPISLLGMSFLSRLNGYEVRGDRLLLRW